MDKIRIEICDDDQWVHEEIEKIIDEYYSESCIIIHYFDGKELLEGNQDNSIILLDIDMPQVDGINAATQLLQTRRNNVIIMLSSITNRFKEAFKIGATRFVTKPIDITEIREAIDNALEAFCGHGVVSVRYLGEYQNLVQRDIVYIKAQRDYVDIHTANKKYDSYDSLKKWIDILDDKLFVSPHKSYIVNMRCIKKITDAELILDSDDKIPISRRRKKEIINKIYEFDKRSRL